MAWTKVAVSRWEEVVNCRCVCKPLGPHLKYSEHSIKSNSDDHHHHYYWLDKIEAVMAQPNSAFKNITEFRAN